MDFKRFLNPQFLLGLGFGVIAFLIIRKSLKKRQPTAKEIVDKYGRDLKGKVAIVTGGNSGIGLETCKALASAGCKVYLCSRSIDNAKTAIQKEIQQPGEGKYVVSDVSNIIVKSLDLESLGSVKAFAEDFLRNEQKIDFLVLNAGIMAIPDLRRTKAGFEKQIGVNHFGHAYLCQFFQPLLVSQKFPSRVVVLSSVAHNEGKVDVTDLNFTKGRKYSPWISYGQSKAANILFAKGLATIGLKDSQSQVSVLSLHPGVIKTALWNQGGPGVKLIASIGETTGLLMDKTIPQGASTTLWACLSPDAGMEQNQGAYLADCAVKEPAVKELSSPELIKSFWEATIKHLAEGVEVEKAASTKNF